MKAELSLSPSRKVLDLKDQVRWRDCVLGVDHLGGEMSPDLRLVFALRQIG
jgi:hypothetical protein